MDLFCTFPRWAAGQVSIGSRVNSTSCCCPNILSFLVPQSDMNFVPVYQSYFQVETQSLRVLMLGRGSGSYPFWTSKGFQQRGIWMFSCIERASIIIQIAAQDKIFFFSCHLHCGGLAVLPKHPVKTEQGMLNSFYSELNIVASGGIVLAEKVFGSECFQNTWSQWDITYTWT